MTSVSDMAKAATAATEPPKPSGLTAKLIMVAKSIGDVPMTGVVKNKSGVVMYRYRTEADILSAVRGPMLEAGLWLSETTIDSDVSDTRAVLRQSFTLHDAESGNTLSTTYLGQGNNAEGNGIKSAYTGCKRYFLLHTFQIPTGDDDELAHAATSAPASSPSDRSAPSRPLTAGALRVVSVESNPTQGGKDRWTAEFVNSAGEPKTANVWDQPIAETLTQAQASGAGVRATFKAAKDSKYPDTVTDAVIVEAPPEPEGEPKQTVSDPRVIQKVELETTHTKGDGTTVEIYRITTDQGPYNTIIEDLVAFAETHVGATVTIRSRAKGGKLWVEGIDLVPDEVTADDIPF